MADFVQTMKDWQRMCNAVKSCEDCPMFAADGGAYSLLGRGIQSAKPEIAAKVLEEWAAEHPEPVYPSFLEWLHKVLPNLNGQNDHGTILELIKTPIPADIAEKLGLKPKES